MNSFLGTGTIRNRQKIFFIGTKVFLYPVDKYYK